MKRDLMLMYGLLAYLLFIVSIGFCIAFLGNILVPRTIDAAPLIPFGEALAVNIALIFMFGLQHSVMARKRFKHWLTSRLHPSLERSTYVMMSSVALLLLLMFWQPMGGMVWAVGDGLWVRLIYLVYFTGWAIMIVATFLIDHFELFGLRQAWTACLDAAAENAGLRTPGLYRHVRHPIYLGWLLVVWATPVMTVSHLLLAAGLTIYMLIGIHFEERDLLRELPEYEQYRRKVPMLLPSLRRRLLQDVAPGQSLRSGSTACSE